MDSSQRATDEEFEATVISYEEDYDIQSAAELVMTRDDWKRIYG